MARLKEQEYGKRTPPPTLWNILKDALSFALKDIWEDPELLEKCYCPVREREYDETVFVESIMSYIDDFVNPANKTPPTLPFVIYGDPGIGKTTFLHHTLKVIAVDKLPICAICLDYRRIAAETLETLKLNFYQKIAEQLWQLPKLQFTSKSSKIKFFQDVFSERLERTILGYIDGVEENSDIQIKIETKIENFMNQPDVLCEDLIHYLTSHHRYVFAVILDNFDHDIGNQMLHLNVLTVAREAIERLRCPVFVPMRNYTKFNAFDRFAGRDVNQFRSLVLSKVDRHAALKMRHSYITGRLPKIRREEVLSGSKKYKVSVEWIVNTLNVTWSAFETNDVYHFIDSVSNGNLRIIWDIISRALQSGYYQAKDNLIDYDTFIRSVLLDNNAFFEPSDERNKVVNIYDNDEVFSSANCLVRIRILQMLEYFANPVIVSKMLRQFLRAGYERQSVLEAIESLQIAGLIEVLPAPEENIDENSIIAISRPGKFYLNEFAFQVPYLDSVLPSTNVSQSFVIVLKQIRRVQGKRLTAELAKDLRNYYLGFAAFIRNMEDQERMNVQHTQEQLFEKTCPRIAHLLEQSIMLHFSRYFQKDYSGYQYDKE